jgi:putative inorganic carbon (hco3(-)) transporter
VSLTAFIAYVVFALLLLAGFWRPVLGILGYLAIYFTYSPDAWWVAATSHMFPRPSLTAVIFLVLAALINCRRLNWSISRREVELYLFLGACWLSSAVFGVALEDENWEYLIKITKIFIFVFFFIRAVNSFINYKMVIWAFILSALFLSYQAHLVKTGGRIDSIGGIDFSEANGFAAFLAITIVFAAFQFLDASWVMKILYVLGIALMCDTLILTQSRAVLIGIAAAVPYVLFRSPPKKLKQIFVYLILGVIMFINLMDANFIARMSTIAQTIQYARSSGMYSETQNIDRLEFWTASLPMFKDHPMGVGIKNFKNIVPQYDPRNPGMDAHNTYVTCYTEIGIIGIALFLIIILEAVLQMNRIRRLVRGKSHAAEISVFATSLGAALVVYLCGYMMTHSILYAEILWILLSMPICLEHAARNLLAENQSAATLDASQMAEQAASP